MKHRLLRMALPLLLTITVAGNIAFAAPATLKAEAGFNHAEDSDGVKTRAWRLAASEEDKPWNITFYRTLIDQPHQSLTDNTALVRYRASLENKAAVSVWLGATHNSILNFYPYALMYDSPLGLKGHFWLSRGREALGTITAYEQRIHADTTGLTFLFDIAPGVTAKAELKRMDYTDNNQRDKMTLTLAKELNANLKFKGGYVYDSADHKVPGIYYVPVQERAYFVGGEWTVPMGKSKLILSGDKSFSARNAEGSIKRHGAGAEFKTGELSALVRYDKSGDYWAHTWGLSWQRAW